MKLICSFYFMVVLLAFGHLGHAQNDNSFIIQVESENDLYRVNAYFSEHSIAVEIKLIAKSIQAYHLIPILNPIRKSTNWTTLLNQCPGIVTFQPNRSYQKRRTTPNDLKFSEQWYLDVINLPDGWDLTTGEVSSGFHQPVIGVLEAGYDFTRPDLEETLFVNPGEIPGNGIDDDNNGFTDDVNGWNFDSDDGVHYIDYTYHGDAVVSIMAARGNNQIGIAGVNWHGKILPLTLEARNTDAATIEAYEYFYQMRKKFNETNGEKGAFIVATNSSFGLDGLFESDAPLFCAMFDKMGSAGILGVGATSNQDVNVDINGDLPSDCSSDDLIVVSSIDKELLNSFSGRGTKNVDLSAPAEKILVVSETGTYIEDSGTSFAAPQVSGVISLAYTLPLDSLQRAIEQNPVTLASTIKSCILESTTQAPDLVDENATGGYLNALAALECVYDKYFVPESNETVSIINLYPNATRDDLRIQYIVNNTQTKITALVYNMLGKRIMQETIDPITENPAKLSVTNLAAGVYALTLVQDGHATTKLFAKY